MIRPLAWIALGLGASVLVTLIVQVGLICLFGVPLPWAMLAGVPFSYATMWPFAGRALRGRTPSNAGSDS